MLCASLLQLLHKQGHGISLLLDDAACVVSAGVSELQTELKELKEKLKDLELQLKKLDADDPKCMPLQQRLAAIEQWLAALQEKENLLLKADQGGRQV